MTPSSTLTTYLHHHTSTDHRGPPRFSPEPSTFSDGLPIPMRGRDHPRFSRHSLWPHTSVSSVNRSRWSQYRIPLVSTPLPAGKPFLFEATANSVPHRSFVPPGPHHLSPSPFPVSRPLSNLQTYQSYPFHCHPFGVVPRTMYTLPPKLRAPHHPLAKPVTRAHISPQSDLA